MSMAMVIGGSRTLAAAGMILVYAVVIGFTDNYVRLIASEAGLWQFHATRTAMALVLIALAAAPFGLKLRPIRPRAVIARSLVHGTAMLFYFGSLAFLPVAQVAAGLFTAPIFVLLISRFAFGRRIGPFRLVAVATGFVGVLFVLGPGQEAPIGLASILPVFAGALYAMGNIATRDWCEGESGAVLTLGFFLALGFYGLVGMTVLALWPLPVPAGEDGFILRGIVAPSATFLVWTFVQAAGSLVAVGAMVKGYQLADASRVSVFEYMVLPAAAMWGWAIWGEVLNARAIFGVLLIFAAGTVIALRNK
ncbi:DMT family transporter [Ostreiculturibacter nitratireducens]|uniref:DMT family transporter n=1 Tax=Ostreiculturibacter nitratireducens TaxID=3075226 RepID=UPI0031B57F5A